MTAKSVLVRPQGLRHRARAPTCPPCYATGIQKISLTPYCEGILLKKVLDLLKAFD